MGWNIEIGDNVIVASYQNKIFAEGNNNSCLFSVHTVFLLVDAQFCLVSYWNEAKLIPTKGNNQVESSVLSCLK